MIEPGAAAAVTATRGGAIGVIGTAGTIASGAYERAIRARAPGVRLLARACPLFVPLVEEGWTDHPVARAVAEEYLGPWRAEGVDTLVLGCTHYPLLAPLLQDVMGPDVRLIVSADETAAAAAGLLARLGLAAPANETATPSARHRFVASDAPDRFLALGQRFLGDAIERVEHVVFG